MEMYFAYGVGMALGLGCILVLEIVEARRGAGSNEWEKY